MAAPCESPCLRVAASLRSLTIDVQPVREFEVSGSSGALRTHNRPATEGMHVSLRADLGNGPDGKVDWEHAAFDHPEPFSWTQFCLEDLVRARAEGRCGSALPTSLRSSL